MKVSAKGLQFIKNYEGFRAQRYLCPAKKPTIGYGHVIQPGESFPRLISKLEAEQLLLKDLDKYTFAVAKHVRVQLSQSQVDALVSFTFNCGIAAFVGSTLLKKLNNRDYKGAAVEFEKWCHVGKDVCPGLLKRRKEERAMFETKPAQPTQEVQKKEEKKDVSQVPGKES